MRSRLAVVAALAAGLFLGLWLRSGAAQPAAEDPLVLLNAAFRAAYRQARTEAVAHTDAIILAEGDKLVLLRGGKRTEADVTAPLYHELKALGHVPLALHVMLAPGSERPLEEAKLEQLRKYRPLVTAARGNLEQRKFPPDLRASQAAMLDHALAFLDKALERKQVTARDLARLTGAREIRHGIEAGVTAAAKAQIDALHRQILAWQNELTVTEWRRLKVVVMGSQMPRREHTQVQYFAKLLHEEGEGRRIVYAEALWDEAKALDLLGTHLVDTPIGQAFFDNPERMHRDLLGEAAWQYLQTLDWDG
jgi:hypothetical protein